jgi:spore coat protein H
MKEDELNEIESVFDTAQYIKINDLYCGIDLERKMILVPIQSNTLMNYSISIKTNFEAIKIGEHIFHSGDQYVIESVSTADSIAIVIYTNDNKLYNAFFLFTTLPIINMYSAATMVDDPKVPCRIFMSFYNNKLLGEQLSSYAGIEIRGRSAMYRPKKSYNLELWVDANGNQRKYKNFLGMRSDDDWILDGMYIDKARMRNKVSMELWDSIITYNPTYFIDGKRYTSSHYCELFMSNSYIGLYNLSEKIDASLIGINKTSGGGALLYKSDYWSATTKFETLTDTTMVVDSWDGWEQIYPEYLNKMWCKPIYCFTDFVMFSSNDEFNNHLSNYLLIENLVDYFIFINTIEAVDNMGANIFYYKKDTNSPFELIPWDMDASWGRNFDSSYLDVHYCMQNLYYERIIQMNTGNFNLKVSERWADLKNGPIQLENLINRFTVLSDELKSSGAIYREKSKWPEMNLDLDNELKYVSGRTNNRIIFLDKLIETIAHNNTY